MRGSGRLGAERARRAASGGPLRSANRARHRWAVLAAVLVASFAVAAESGQPATAQQDPKAVSGLGAVQYHRG